MTSVTSSRPAIWPGRISLFAIGLVLGLALPVAAFATNFNITNASTSAQTLGSGSGQTGTISSTGSLTVSGGTVAVTISGNNATLTNNGTIKQTGNDRAIRDNTGVTGLTITNGSATNSTALMQTADADVIQMNKAAGSLVFNNYGTLNSLNASKGGAQAIDFNAITSGSNVLNNFGTGVIQARDGDAVRTGVNGFIYNYGQIKSTITTDDGTDGVDFQNNTGANVTNYSTGTIEGARHGITGGAADSSKNFTATITNNAGGTIRGMNGSGLNLDGFNSKTTASINNAGTITGNGVSGDGDGVDVDGVVNLTNTGIIRSINAVSSSTPAQSEGITAGGGTITNSGTIEGLVAAGNSNAIGRGITLAGVDTSGTLEPIYSNTVVTNQSGGLIRGQNNSGIAVGGSASGFTVTVNNNAGATIRGAGASAATIQTGSDNDTVINAGSIINDGGSTKTAVDLGGGADTLTYSGGSIVGAINGGTGTNTLNLANSVSHASATQNFQSVNVATGSATLAGIVSGTTLAKGGAGTLNLTAANTYTGNTTVTAGTLQVNNDSGSATGSGAVLVQSGAVLSGGGFLNGLVTVDGIIAPGNSIGTLSTGSDVVWDGSATNKWAFQLGAAGLSDRLNVGEDFLKGTGTAGNFYFDFLSGGTVGTFILVDWTGISTFLASDFSYANLAAGYTGSFSIQGSQLEFTTIPEPATTSALFGTVTLALVAALRRRRRSFGAS